MPTNKISQPAGLISVLLDPTARIDERDDAAMDLAFYSEPEAIAALLTTALDSSCDDTIRDSCGESLAEIWIQTNNFNPAMFASLSGAARRAASALISATRPDWLSEVGE